MDRIHSLRARAVAAERQRKQVTLGAASGLLRQAGRTGFADTRPSRKLLEHGLTAQGQRSCLVCG